MIYGSDYLPWAGIHPPGPPLTTMSELNPSKLKAWVTKENTRHGISMAAPSVAGERRIRAWGFGSQRWDPSSSLHLPMGWIRDYSERVEARVNLLCDINDLVR
jgi:hypothetical protein